MALLLMNSHRYIYIYIYKERKKKEWSVLVVCGMMPSHSKRGSKHTIRRQSTSVQNEGREKRVEKAKKRTNEKRKKGEKYLINVASSSSSLTPDKLGSVLKRKSLLVVLSLLELPFLWNYVCGIARERRAIMFCFFLPHTNLAVYLNANRSLRSLANAIAPMRCMTCSAVRLSANCNTGSLWRAHNSNNRNQKKQIRKEKKHTKSKGRQKKKETKEER